MTTRRTLGGAGAVLAAAVVLAACGGGGGGGAKTPSTLDPANMVPASSVVYVSSVVRPQGVLNSNLVEAIDSIAGRGTAERLAAKIKSSKSLDWKQLKPWLGERVGLAITGFPSQLTNSSSIENNVVVVAPTADPSSARIWLRKHAKSGKAVWKIVGHYVLIGGAHAVGQAQATTAKTSLASDSGFSSDMSQLGSDAVFSAYAPAHQLVSELVPLLKNLPAYSGSTASQAALSNAAKQAPPGSSLAIGFSALHNQFRMDVVEHGIPHSNTNTHVSGVASDVSSLPAGSWLAVTLGGTLAKAGYVSKLSGTLSKSLTTLQNLQGAGAIGSQVRSGPLQFIVKDLLPALGPAELSVSGTSGTTLQAGLVMAPDDRAAGGRLVAGIKRLVSGLPISATSTGGRVAVTFGISNLQQLLHPSSTLAGNPTFKGALAQLPAGAKADVYLNFSGIDALAALSPNTGSPSTMRVLRRLAYLIAGGTQSHFRLVLATH
jgi:hypothetical protein